MARPLCQVRRPLSRRAVLTILLPGLLLAGLVGAVNPAHAAILAPTRFDDPAPDGCSPTDCSLREAVIAANADAGADVIKLPAGFYSLTIPGTGENASATGDLDLLFPVTIEGAGADVTTISGAGNGDRIIEFPYFATGPVTIAGVTIRDGVTAHTEQSRESGGGISMESFRSGIRALEEMTLREVHITANRSNRDGGGVANAGGVLTIIDSTVSRNSAYDNGGGLWLSTLVTLTNVTISDNSARAGGGIYKQGSWPDGEPNDLQIHNSTITANRAGSAYGGGGIVPGFGTTAIRNTIVAGNHHVASPGNSSSPDCLGMVVSQAYNLIGNNAGCEGLGGTDQFGTPAAPLSAKLSLLGGGPPGGPKPGTTAYFGGHGGPTPTHALLEGSPAIDRGSPHPPGTSETSCSARDQRGMPRPQGGACDVGAHELGQCLGLPVNRIGTPGADTMNGTNAPEVFMGFSGDDTVNGGGGNDVVCAGDGDDTLIGGGESDRLDGGPGVDTATFAGVFGPAGASIDLAQGTAHGAGIGSDQLMAIENAVGSSASDHLRGNAGPNVLDGLGGNDTLNGLEGNDLLSGGAGANRIWGGSGDDRLVGGAGPDHLLGGSGADELVGGSGRDHLDGHGGSDSLLGGPAADELRGGPGDDSLLGNAGRDRLLGGRGFDSCIGGKGRDLEVGCESAFPFLK